MMDKRFKKKLIIILITLGILFFLSYKVVSIFSYKNKITLQLQTIPEFQLLTLEQTFFSRANLKTNLNTIFIYFNSECDFCQHESQSISQNINKFKDVQFIFVSTENIEIIKQFSEQYKLNNQNNITFLYDSNYLFSNIFDANSIPYILIYNKNNNLIKRHNGQLNANGILRVLNQND